MHIDMLSEQFLFAGDVYGCAPLMLGARERSERILSSAEKKHKADFPNVNRRSIVFLLEDFAEVCGHVSGVQRSWQVPFQSVAFLVRDRFIRWPL